MNKDTRSDAELNAIIAEWSGWKKGHSVHWSEGLPQKFYDWGWTPPDELVNTSIRYTPGKTSCEPPDYCSDLNAIHEAEKHLSKPQEEKYVVTLCLEIQPVPSLFNATARQRAEAIVAVIEAGGGK